MSGQPGAFAEIEVTSNEILIRRSGSGTLAPELLDTVYAILLNVADQLANARSPWDGEEVDGEAVFFLQPLLYPMRLNRQSSSSDMIKD